MFHFFSGTFHVGTFRSVSPLLILFVDGKRGSQEMNTLYLSGCVPIFVEKSWRNSLLNG